MKFNLKMKPLASAVAAVGILAAAATGWSQGESAQDKSIPTSKVERLNRAPVSKEILQVKLPRPVEATLSNGINVMILEDHRFPLVTVQFDINGAGPLYEPAKQPGLAGATARMLEEGTKTRTSKQIAEQIDSLARRFPPLRVWFRFGHSVRVGIVGHFRTMVRAGDGRPPPSELSSGRVGAIQGACEACALAAAFASLISWRTKH